MKPSIKWRGDVVFSSSIYQVVLVTMFAKHCGQTCFTWVHMLRAPSWRIKFHEPESCLLFMWVKLHSLLLTDSLVGYMLTLLFTSVSVKAQDIHLTAFVAW